MTNDPRDQYSRIKDSLEGKEFGYPWRVNNLDTENSFTVLWVYSFTDPSSAVTLKRATPPQLGCICNMHTEEKTSSGIRIMVYQFLSRQLKTIPKPTESENGVYPDGMGASPTGMRQF